VLSSGKQRDLWQLPEETEALGAGDCEDLAIWLYSKLLSEGLSNIRFTVGLAGSEENQSMHAWVTWYERGEIYILDPSRRGGIFGPGQSGSITYQPYYSYYLNQKWHHR
jgi:predicted transglutaminase-like cysteine proteinase